MTSGDGLSTFGRRRRKVYSTLFPMLKGKWERSSAAFHKSPRHQRKTRKRKLDKITEKSSRKGFLGAFLQPRLYHSTSDAYNYFQPKTTPTCFRSLESDFKNFKINPNRARSILSTFLNLRLKWLQAAICSQLTHAAKIRYH